MTTTPPAAPGFEELLDYLHRTRGFDFTAYKRPTLMRRIEKRMQTIGVGSFTDYVDYLEVHPDEFPQLFNVILINVTSFFRDEDAWKYIQEQVVPQVLNAKGPEASVRVWSAGCASGEEAYTLAIIFAEALGQEQFLKRAKIYATDADEEALAKARMGVYTAKDVAAIPAELRDKYFERLNNAYLFRKELRRSLIFGRHDLLQDAPISRIDLLVCRNTLMYFNVEAQARIIARFHFALNDGGMLFLGKAEMLLNHNATYTPVDLKRRVFMKRTSGSVRDRLLLMAQAGREREEVISQLTSHVRLREASFDLDTMPLIIIDEAGMLAMANAAARSLFGLSTRDIGRPLQDLEVSYRPLELRSLIDKVNAERRPIVHRDVPWPTGTGEQRFFDVYVQPLPSDGDALLGIKVSFSDTTVHWQMQQELHDSKQELETAYEELQSTNEELETTNEELQSTVEELETTNEELQSSNEEMETMNEELQSTNEELETVNDELHQRTDELHRTNEFLRSILTSLRDSVIVVDRNTNVTAWNRRSEELWGLRAEEAVGKHLLGLDIGLPLDALRLPVRACLTGELSTQALLLHATNRRGKPITVRVVCSLLEGRGEETRGALLHIEEVSDGARGG